MSDPYSVWAVIAFVLGAPFSIGLARGSGWEAGLRGKPLHGAFEYFISALFLAAALWGVGYLSHMYL